MPSSFDTDHVRFHNLDVVIRRIQAVGSGAEKYMMSMLERIMLEDIWPLWIQHISLQDHSLEDLAHLGHPYSTRFDVDSFIHPDSEVHRQSGSIIEGSHINAENRSVKLTNSSPHYIFLRYGTRTMRMRDPAGTVMAQALPAIKRRITEEMRGAIVELLTS